MNTARRIALSGIAAVAFASSAVAAPPLELLSIVAMPGVAGRIDHLSADPGHHRLFVAALGNDTVEVLDTERPRRDTIRGLGAPQGVLYVAGSNRLVIANGGANRVDIVAATSFAVKARVDGMQDADNVRYDAALRKVLVGYGEGALRILDAVSGQSGGDIALPGHPESFQLEQRGNRAYVNVPSARSVVVVDRTTREVVSRWKLRDATQNFPMALDEDDGRLFVGVRLPPLLLVYDTGSGNEIARLPVGADTDDVFFDAKRKRVYVICGAGNVVVFHQANPHRYVREASIDTAPRARTGLFVAEDDRLYVAAPARAGQPARMLVYRVD